MFLDYWVHYEVSKDTFTIRSLLYLQTFETFEASSQPYMIQYFTYPNIAF